MAIFKSEEEIKMEIEAFETEISVRAVDYMAFKHWAKSQFAFNINVGRTTFYEWLDKHKSGLTPLRIAQFCPEVSLEWLIRGDGPMLKSELDHPHPTTPYSVTRTYEPESTPASSAPSAVKEPLPVPDSAHFINVLINRIEQQAVEIASLAAKKTELEAQIATIKSGLKIDTEQ